MVNPSQTLFRTGLADEKQHTKDLETKHSSHESIETH